MLTRLVAFLFKFLLKAVKFCWLGTFLFFFMFGLTLFGSYVYVPPGQAVETAFFLGLVAWFAGYLFVGRSGDKKPAQPAQPQKANASKKEAKKPWVRPLLSWLFIPKKNDSLQPQTPDDGKMVHITNNYYHHHHHHHGGGRSKRAA